MDKIPENFGKTSENLGKIRAQMAPNVVLFQKMAANVCRKTQLRPFLEATPQTGFHTLFRRKFVGKRRTKRFGQIRGDSGKNPSHPRTFAYSYTYAADNDCTTSPIAITVAHARWRNITAFKNTTFPTINAKAGPVCCHKAEPQRKG